MFAEEAEVSDNIPKLIHKKCTFTNEPDSCDPDELAHSLTVETQDAGGGVYLVLSTKRWALDPRCDTEWEEFRRMLLDVLEGVEEL